MTFWGAAATVFLAPVWIGMAVTSAAIVLFLLLTLEALRRPQQMFTLVAEYVTPDILQRAHREVRARPLHRLSAVALAVLIVWCAPRPTLASLNST